MSMNVRLGTDTCHCSVIRQTTTEDTKKILESPDPMQAYFDWLRRQIELWRQQDIEDGEDPGDDLYDEQYENETQSIAAYAAAHPTAEWTMI